MNWSGLPATIENKIIPEPNSGCWLWIGVAYPTTGYGKIVKTANKKRTYLLSHRVVFEALRYSIPSDLEIDHLCRNRICCNPDHVEPVTSFINNMRGLSAAAINARKTHCKRGHLLEGDNIYVREGYFRRHCRICNKLTRKPRK